MVQGELLEIQERDRASEHVDRVYGAVAQVEEGKNFTIADG